MNRKRKLVVITEAQSDIKLAKMLIGSVVKYFFGEITRVNEFHSGKVSYIDGKRNLIPKIVSQITQILQINAR